MKITYLGHSAFKLEHGVSVLFDPFKDIGYDMQPQEADVVLCSHAHYDHHAVELVQSPNVIDYPFNGRICSIAITSKIVSHDEANGAKRGTCIVFKVFFNGKSFVHLADVGVIDADIIDFAKGCDFLFVPVGGYYTIDHAQAKEYIDRIKPAHAIAMHYKTAKCNINIQPPAAFISQFESVTTLPSSCPIEEVKDKVCIFEAP